MLWEIDYESIEYYLRYLFRCVSLKLALYDETAYLILETEFIVVDAGGSGLCVVTNVCRKLRINGQKQSKI